MPPDTAGFDDIYVLTIPSFQWYVCSSTRPSWKYCGLRLVRIKLYPDGDKTGQYPHHSLSCDVIDNSQMIIIGGTFPLFADCDVPEQFGTHNLDMGLQNPDKAPWQLFRPTNLTTYSVPDPILRVIGGSGRGGSVKRAPDKGFSNPDLKVLMTRKATFAVRTPTRDVTQPTDTSNSNSGKSRPLSAGAIGGIAAGSAVAFLLFLATAIWCIRRRRHRRQALLNEKQPAPGTNGNFPPTTSDGRHPWPPHSPTSPSFSPTSPPPTSPFLTASAQYYAARPPAELDAAPGSNIWHSSDGITYELIPPSSAGGGGSPFSGAAGSSTTGTGSSEVMQTKIDSEGRVWVQVPMTVGGGGSSYMGPSPITPESAGPPQELDTDDKRENAGWVGVGGSSGGGPGERMGERMGERAGVHQTYYHP